MKIEKNFQKQINLAKKSFRKLSKVEFKKSLKSWTKTKMD